MTEIVVKLNELAELRAEIRRLRDALTDAQAETEAARDRVEAAEHLLRDALQFKDGPRASTHWWRESLDLAETIRQFLGEPS